MSAEPSEASTKCDFANLARQYLSGRVDSDSNVAPNASGFSVSESKRILRTRSHWSGPTSST